MVCLIYAVMPALAAGESKRGSRWAGKLARPSSGLMALLGFATILVFVVWFFRARHATIPENVALTLICFSFAWTYLAMWRVVRGCRKLCWKRSNYRQFLSGPRPGDPDELVIWQWTFQLCYAVLAVVLSVFAIVLTA
jgi:hypothetical protein